MLQLRNKIANATQQEISMSKFMSIVLPVIIAATTSGLFFTAALV